MRRSAGQKTCAKPALVGEACDPAEVTAPDCFFLEYLDCAAGICTPPAIAPYGEPCDPLGSPATRCAASGLCSGGVCEPPAGLGEACGPGVNPACMAPAACPSGVCSPLQRPCGPCSASACFRLSACRGSVRGLRPMPLASRLRAAAASAVLFGAAAALADEGQWPPAQLAELDLELLRGRGLELGARELWGERGLLRAVVNLSGCSGAFVSAEGLIATNHHCAYRALAAASTPERDLLRDGFVARRREDEPEAKGITVEVLEKISDVTAKVAAAAAAAGDDRERFRAVDRERKRLVAECEQQPARRCKVAGFFSGKRWELHESLELRDVRLVWAPPAAIGEYGGEIDNWQWPRHTGDFALLRAYVGPDARPAERAADNRPYAPPRYLEPTADGVRPGELVMVLGYPSVTRRWLPLPEVQRQIDQVLPRTLDLYGEWLKILDEQAAASPSVALKLAARRKALANRHKNARGMLDGIRRMRLLDRRRSEAARIEEAAKKNTALASVPRAIEELTRRARDGFERDTLLESLPQGPPLLGAAIDLVRRARERPKPDIERVEAYQDRNAVRLWKSIELRLREHDVESEARLVGSLAARAAKLPEAARVAPLARLGEDAAAATGAARGKLRASRLAASARATFDAADASAVARSADPIVVLARELVVAIEQMEAEREARDGAWLALGPGHHELVRTVRGGPVYPDANGTLRVSFAKLAGYGPREGLIATPQTTLGGALDKHTAEEPFRLPQPVLDRAAAARESYWADPVLEDVPTCFLSDADTTGGNSGSPVVDGRGRLVGLNFDRVWENVAGDYGYSADRSRNVSVDVRYLFWLLDRVDDAGALLRELGVAGFRSAARRPSAGTGPRPPRPAVDAGAAPGGPGRSSCAIRRGTGGSPAGWAGAALLGLVLLRRRLE